MTDRFYLGGGPDVKGGSTWRQCRSCRGYAQDSTPLVHAQDCPVAEVERLQKGYEILFDDGPEAIEARLGTESELPTDRENAAHLRKRLETK